MKKIIWNKSSLFLLPALTLGVVVFTFYQLLGAGTSPLSVTIEGMITQGKQQLFQKTISGVSNSYQIFLSAKNQYEADATREQKIKLHAYLALTRFADVLLRSDGPEVDTARKLLARYGITFTGDNIDDIQSQLPVNSQDKPILPATAPSGEALRVFLAGPFLTAVNASIADMDLAIGFLVAKESKEIISKTLIDPAIDPSDPTQPDVEVDDGDYYLFRAMLKAMKGVILTWTAYNQDFDVRELAALGNANMVNIQKFLDRYPDLLKVRAGGPAALTEAKLAFIGAIVDYLAASDKISNNSDLQEGATELFAVESDQDKYNEGLLRENFAKIKYSLQGNGAVQFVNDRIGTEYRVYGATSFSTTEASWWEKGYTPEKSGYDYLGTASATQTFTGGTYAYYIITTKPGNIAPVDAVQGTNGTNVTYLSTSITGNTSNWFNIGGAPNGSYALVGGNGNSGGFIVISPAATINSLTVTLASAADVAPRVDYGKKINYSPIFGNGTTALNPRDLLPQFSSLGWGHPIAGTVGHGLNDDPTLGGIAPDQTQPLWQKGDQLQPTGVFTIPTATITVDGAVSSDWNSVLPVLEDVTGETDPSRDLAGLYLAKDGTYLYFRIDLAGNYASYNEYEIRFRKLPGDAFDVVGDVRYGFTYQPGLARWQLYKRTYQGNGAWSSSADIGLNNVSGNGSSIEGRILLTTVGELGGRFIGVSTSPWRDDRNYTSIQITPAASVTGTLTIPNYNDAGPIYIKAYRYVAGIGFDTDQSDKLGGQVIFPGQYTAGMTYTINNLPVGEKIFVFAQWDKDMNGIVSPGDYTNFYLPSITTAGNNSLDIVTPDDHRSFPPPVIRQARVFSSRNPNGTTTIQFQTNISGPGPEDVTIAVHGPGGDFTLAPSVYNQQKGLSYNLPSTVARPGYVPDGDYTFEAVDSLGRRATPVTYHYAFNGQLPLVSTAAGTFSPANRGFVGKTTPTLFWQAPTTGGPYYYQVQIEDWFGNDIWFQSDIQAETFVTVPEGLLQPDTPYRWIVRLFDSADHPMNRTQTQTLFFHTGTGGPPEISTVSLLTRTPAGTQRYSTSINVTVTNVFPDNVGYIALVGPTPATTILTSYTYNASNPQPPITYQFTGSANYSISYSPNPSAFPAAGTYTAKVTYQRPGEASPTTLAMDVPYEHKGPVLKVDLSSLSLPDNDYFDTTTPAFSWSPVGDPNTYYRLSIRDTLDYWTVWNSNWTKETSVVVPPGVLDPGRSYYWVLRSSSDYDPSRSSTTGKYNSYIDAHADGTKLRFTVNKPAVSFPAPVFKQVSIFSRKDLTGTDISLAAAINGPSPDDVTVTVHGPGGSFTLSPSQYHQQKGMRYVYVKKSSSLANGDYIFEAVDSYGRRAQPVTYHYEYNETLPFVDAVTSPADRSFVGTTTPTLSWQPPAGGGSYYFVRITDWLENEVFFESSIQAETSVTVPSGLLQPDTPYKWFVRVYDSADHPMNCTQSPSLAFHTGTAQTPALQQVNLRVRSTGATQTSYRVGIEINKLWGLFPDEVKEIRLKDASGTLQQSFSQGANFIKYHINKSAYYNMDNPSATPLTTGNYTVEVDYQRSGETQATTLATAPFPYEYHPVSPVDVTSLIPGDNTYFDSATPTFSWSPVIDPGTFYRLLIREPIRLESVWASDWSKATTVTVPVGILSRGGTYYWRVQSSSDYDPSLDQATGRYDSYAFTMANGAMANFRFTVNGSPSTIKGDLNDDGKVDLLDAVTAMQVLSGMKPGLRAYYPTSGVDVGNNGKVGSEDLIYILQGVSGLR